MTYYAGHFCIECKPQAGIFNCFYCRNIYFLAASIRKQGNSSVSSIIVASVACAHDHLKVCFSFSVAGDLLHKLLAANLGKKLYSL